MTAAPALPWAALEAQLRPFVAARVRQQADVDDILQTVLLRTYERVSSVREGKLTGWLFTVARNAITDFYRAQQRAPDGLDDAPVAEPAPDDDDWLSPRMAQVLVGFVDLLPPKYREAIRLTELEGRTQQQAADLVGISLSGMKSRVQRGRAMLIEAMHACCEFELDRRGRIIDYDVRDEGCACAAVGCAPRP